MKHRPYLWRLLVILALGVLASNAHANSLNFASDAFLVPYVTFTSSTATSVVGLTSRDSGTIYWKFFDQDGSELQSGSMRITANHMLSFNWASVANPSLAGTKGYLLFYIDTDGDGMVNVKDDYPMAANAFFIDVSSSDIVFIPTVMVSHSGLSSTDPATFTVNSLPLALYGYGALSGTNLALRYYLDGAPGGEDSTIVLWTVGNPGPTQAATMYDDAGNSKTITLDTPKARLNVIDPETIADRPTGYTDGFIQWNSIPDAALAAYGFTLVHTTAFGAVQTLLASQVN